MPDTDCGGDVPCPQCGGATIWESGGVLGVCPRCVGDPPANGAGHLPGPPQSPRTRLIVAVCRANVQLRRRLDAVETAVRATGRVLTDFDAILGALRADVLRLMARTDQLEAERGELRRRLGLNP